MEIFFYQSSVFDEINIEELLFYRYKQIDFIYDKTISEGILFINKVLEKRDEEKYFAMWLQRYPFMSKDAFVTFDDFYNQITGKNIVNKSKKEILEESAEILRSMEGGEAGGT